MEPMKPMQPMEALKPMARIEPWWPRNLGEPSSAGAQDGMRYAFFPDARRLLVEENGAVTSYDTGERRINGVSQAAGTERNLAFSSDEGPVDLATLRRAE